MTSFGGIYVRQWYASQPAGRWRSEGPDATSEIRNFLFGSRSHSLRYQSSCKEPNGRCKPVAVTIESPYRFICRSQVGAEPSGQQCSRGRDGRCSLPAHDQGNQPIFYPVSADTNRPMGQLLYRIAPGSDWRPLSAPELSPTTPAQVNVRGHIAWVEMPPGGWADGEYEDLDSPAGEHAYVLDLKFAADGKVSPLLSHAPAPGGRRLI